MKKSFFFKKKYFFWAYRVANVDGIDAALGLEVVEGQLVANGRVGLVAEAPRVFIELGSVLHKKKYIYIRNQRKS